MSGLELNAENGPRSDPTGPQAGGPYGSSARDPVIPYEIVHADIWKTLMRRDNRFAGGKAASGIRSLSYPEAWVELLQTMTYGKSGRVVEVDGLDVQLRPGELLLVQSFLKAKFGWSTSRLRRFQELLFEIGAFSSSRNICTTHSRGRPTIIARVAHHGKSELLRESDRKENRKPDRKTLPVTSSYKTRSEGADTRQPTANPTAKERPYSTDMPNTERTLSTGRSASTQELAPPRPPSNPANATEIFSQSAIQADQDSGLVDRVRARLSKSALETFDKVDTSLRRSDRRDDEALTDARRYGLLWRSVEEAMDEFDDMGRLEDAGKRLGKQMRAGDREPIHYPGAYLHEILKTVDGERAEANYQRNAARQSSRAKPTTAEGRTSQDLGAVVSQLSKGLQSPLQPRSKVE